MSLADPLISDEKLAEIKSHLSDGCPHDDDEMQWDCGVYEPWCTLLLAEVARLREHNKYLTRMFYGIASLKLCKRHNAVPIVDRVRERVTAPWCQDCTADENVRLRAVAASDPTPDTLCGACSHLTSEHEDGRGECRVPMAAGVVPSWCGCARMETS